MRDFAERERIYLPNTALRADLDRLTGEDEDASLGGRDALHEKFLRRGARFESMDGRRTNCIRLAFDESIVELNRIFRRTFAIVDGIVGMEGNGPIQGTPKPAGVLVMGADLVAVDATCCRIMGIDPEKVEYLRMAADMGHVRAGRIQQRGEVIDSVCTPYELIAKFQHLRMSGIAGTKA